MQTKGLIYVAGQYRAPTIEGIRANIAKARVVAERLWKEGWIVFCPHLNSAEMDGIVPAERFLEGDMVILRACDAIYMMREWEWSDGAVDERLAAISLGLDVIYEPPPPIKSTGLDTGEIVNGSN